MSDVLRGEVQAVSLVSLKVEAEKVARQFLVRIVLLLS